MSVLKSVAVLLALPAAAQDAASPPDWDLTRDPGQQLTMASISYDSGIAIAARCMKGNFELLVAGLPEAPGREPIRNLGIAFQDEEMEDRSWTVSEARTAAFSHLPAPFARSLREGGRLQIRASGERGQPARRYVIDLPASATAVEAALTACGRPLEDPRDRDLTQVVGEGVESAGLRWTRRPEGSFPSSGRDVAWASVALTCVVQSDERLDECLVESEHPGGYGFGDATLRAARRGRVGPTPDSPVGAPFAGRRITYRTTYRMLQ